MTKAGVFMPSSTLQCDSFAFALAASAYVCGMSGFLCMCAFTPLMYMHWHGNTVFFPKSEHSFCPFA